MFSKIYQSSLQLVSQSDYLEAIKGTAGLSCTAQFLNYERNYEWLINYHGHIGKDQLAQNGQGMVLGIQTVETGVLAGLSQVL